MPETSTLPELLEGLLHTLQHNPQAVQMMDARGCLVDRRRSKGRRPATITLAVSDRVAVSLSGPEDKARVRLLVFAVEETALARARSPIILPDEARAGRR